MEIINKDFYEYVEEIDDNYNPLENAITEESLEEEVKLREKTLRKLVENSMFIWLYPNHKLPISEVRELLKPIIEDENQVEELGRKVGSYLTQCLEMRQSYVEERKNLKAQVNKK
jgi:hypothetical protein